MVVSRAGLLERWCETVQVAVGHSPEGKGHATRMLAVAEQLAARGHDVALAGGGPGERFVSLAGYEEATLAEVDFSNARGPLAVAREFVRGLRRLRDAARWLRRTAPDRVVADDAFVALAAVALRLDCVVVTHTAASLFDGRRERVASRLANAVLGRLARDVVCPTIPGSSLVAPRGATTVPPIALDGVGTAGVGDGSSPVDAAGDPPAGSSDATAKSGDGPSATEPPREDVGVLVVPSAYSPSFDRVVQRLRADRTVTVAAGTGRTLVPTIAAAKAVVCSGYSTMMEAAVAGTPCVVVPATPEQRGVAGAVADRPGFETAGSPAEVVAALDSVAEPEPTENGAAVVAETVVG